MISLKELKRLTNDNFVPNDQEYLKVQSYFEGYLKRLLFISLRLQNIKYSNCQEIVTNAKNDLNLTQQLNLSFITLTKTNLADIKKTDSDFELLEKAIISFCRPVRNKLAHGSDYKIDSNIIRLCIWITQEFVKKIESHLYRLKYYSAFDKPKSWGATKVGKADIPESILKSFGFKLVSNFDEKMIRGHFKKSSLLLPLYV